MIALAFAWLSGLVDMTTMHIQANQGDITLAAVQAKATDTPAGLTDGLDRLPGQTASPTPGQIVSVQPLHLAKVSE